MLEHLLNDQLKDFLGYLKDKQLQVDIDLPKQTLYVRDLTTDEESVLRWSSAEQAGRGRSFPAPTHCSSCGLCSLVATWA